MAWNQRLYRAGYDAANYTIRNLGTEAARAEYNSLDGASAVNEFEVGYRTRLEEALEK